MAQSGEPLEIIFPVKSGKTQVSDVRDLRGTIEREKAVGGVLITLTFFSSSPMKGFACSERLLRKFRA